MFLTRDQFRNEVLRRDGYKCVICGYSERTGLDVHHIIERRIWGDNEGYCLDNGATLCPTHHFRAEQTVLTCEKIREKAGIKKVVLPDHLYEDTRYDKWANIILPDGRRLKGELFFDSSVQKILKSGRVLSYFCKYVKYPRTWHLPWSNRVHRNDCILDSTKHFEGKRVVVQAKMDGENTTLYNDYLHTRSIDGTSHPSRSWVKSYHAKMAYNIPEGWRICGENMYAKHTVFYENLRSYFLVFSIWNEKNECLSWPDMLEWVALLNLDIPPVLYIGEWDENVIRDIDINKVDGDQCEGYVVRLADSFSYGDFRRSVAKFVKEEFANKLRKGSSHWRYKKIIPNKLKKRFKSD